MTAVREYRFQWVRPPIDLAELAKLRFTEKWPMQRLARHFKCGTTALYLHIKRRGKMMDLTELIKGLLVVIGIAMATGHYGDLQRWARKEAFESLEWKQDLPSIFIPSTHKGKTHAH